MPNPLTAPPLPAEAIAEGERLLAAVLQRVASSGLDVSHTALIFGLSASDVRNDATEALNILPALLRAASERDAAVREVEELKAKAKLDYATYVKAYYEHKSARNENAMDRCGARILTLERIFPELEAGVVIDPSALGAAP